MSKKSKNVFFQNVPNPSQLVQSGPKAPSKSQAIVFDHLHSQNKFRNFLKSRNFDHEIHFWKVGCLTSLKNAFGRSTKKLTCFSILLFRSNVTREAKYGTISNFLSYGFAIQGLVLKKFHFSTSSCEKTFKIKLKLLQKCLKKCKKKSFFFFFQNVPNPSQLVQSGPQAPPGSQATVFDHPTSSKVFLKKF